MEWLTWELGADAGLVDFAKRFRELFGESIGVKSQKSACLELYREYAKVDQMEERGPYETLALARKKLVKTQRGVGGGDLGELRAQGGWR